MPNAHTPANTVAETLSNTSANTPANAPATPSAQTPATTPANTQAGPAESANQPLAAMHALPDTAPCPCGRCEPAAKRQPRPVAFGNCCAPLLRGQQAAADAQALMRSRYSAYVLGDLAYLRSSWHPSTCPPDLSLDDDVQWLGLKIERYHPTSATEAEVVFVARYRHKGRAYRLHEHSRFVREQGRWLYLDAIG